MFHDYRGIRHGDPIFPRIFRTDLERMVDKIEQKTGRGIAVHGVTFCNLRFADDIDMIDDDMVELRNIV